MRDWEEKEDARARVLMRIYGIEMLVFSSSMKWR
jgi:hypothetical protein